tara:strand:- start:3732 stop:4475 length:744 start_codon:yes stop_codon:yes gene_type:complete
MIEVERIENISLIRLNRPKVNAIDDNMLDLLCESLVNAEQDKETNTILITGTGSFFSFGLDLPTFLEFKREDLKNSIYKLLDLCRSIYLSKKITVASINGHATGGGCMIALSCDFKHMTDSKAKIALNEINIGLSLFSSTIVMLRESIGINNSKKLLLTGDLINPQEALDIGLINNLYSRNELYEKSLDFSRTFKSKNKEIIKIMKQEILGVTKEGLTDSEESIDDFLDIFYSEPTQEILKTVQIRK